MNRKWNPFDAERERKELEAERRKLRLIQVREESKKLAKNLRTKVANEKSRQLKTFEENKTKELDCWRQQTLQQKFQDYRTSIFEIGTAHKAAAAEKLLQAARCDKNSKFKVETNANKRALIPEVTVTRNKTVGVNTEGTDNATSKRPKGHTSQKNHVGFCEINPKQRNVLGGCDEKQPAANKEDPEVSVGRGQQKETKKKPLDKNPVIVEIDVENCDNVSISEFDVADTHVQSNRKFTRVVRLTPKKNVTTKISVQQGGKENDKDDKNVSHEYPKPTEIPKCLDNVEVKAVSFNDPVVKPRKRISAISDFLSNNMKTAPVPECVPNIDTSEMRAKVDLLLKKDRENVQNIGGLNNNSLIKDAFEQKKHRLTKIQDINFTNCCPNRASRLDMSSCNMAQDNAVNKQPEMPKPISQYRKVSDVSKAREYNLDKKTELYDKDTSQVEYYDYINRYSRTYKQPSNLIQVEPSNTKTPNAIDLAKQEKKTEDLERITKMQKQRADTEERGKKAIEKEQLAKECHKFTEQLDNIMSKHSDLLYQKDKGTVCPTKPKEVRINADDVFLQPAIITCPLVQDCHTTTAFKKDGFNLADIPDKCGKPPDTNLFFLNDCERIMHPVKGIPIDTNEACDPQKAEKLKMLMNRVEDLRVALMEELRKEDDVGPTIKTKSGRKASNETNLNKLVNGHKSSVEKLEKDKDSIAKNFKVSSSDGPFEIIIQMKGNDIIDIKQKLGDKNQSIFCHPKTSDKAITTNQQFDICTTNDSNSTSYKSLPSVTKNKKVVCPRQHCDSTTLEGPRPLHPLIEHYLQRLLFMNQKSIDDLGVSCSDVETPNTSIICTKENQMPANESLAESKLRQMDKFISDNRSFISQLERSVTSQRNTSPQRTMEIFDSIWQNHLGKAGKDIRVNKQKPQARNDDSMAVQKPKQSVRSSEREEREVSSSQTKETTAPSTSEASKTTQKHISCSARKNVANEKKCDPEVQIERYAELTENCTQRIKELTELITLVRLEKKKLLEVTLSSISDTGRNSTEYIELPGDRKSFPDSTKTSEDAARTNSISPVSTEEGQGLSHRMLNEEQQNSESDQHLSSACDKRDLVQGKTISTSLDSGISGSRPVTVLEQQPEVTLRACESARPQSPHNLNTKKSRPPPTLNRFSPHMIEGEQIHELSTITEVETPITSKVNASLAPNAPALDGSACSSAQLQTSENSLARGFPNFDDYMRNIKVDLSSLNLDESARLQSVVDKYIASLSNAKKSGFSLEHFPDLSSYIDFNCTPGLQATSLQDNIKEAIDRMRQQEIPAKPFPSKNDYIRNCCKTNTMPYELDSDSLENISDNTLPHKATAGSGSDSMDIEQELRKRNLLKKDFRRNRYESGDANFAESTRNDACNSRVSSLESSSSANRIAPSPLTHQSQRKYISESDISSTTTSITIPTPGKSDRATAMTSRKAETSECKNMGKPLNLRDFLNRELEKHSHSSSLTSTCSNDSIRNLFLQSILENLSPSGHSDSPSGGSGGGTGLTLDRQKTSTPVASSNANTLSPRTSSNFFSGESQISSVVPPYRENERLKVAACAACRKKHCTCNCK